MISLAATAGMISSTTAGMISSTTAGMISLATTAGKIINGRIQFTPSRHIPSGQKKQGLKIDFVICLQLWHVFSGSESLKCVVYCANILGHVELIWGTPLIFNPTHITHPDTLLIGKMTDLLLRRFTVKRMALAFVQHCSYILVIVCICVGTNVLIRCRGYVFLFCIETMITLASTAGMIGSTTVGIIALATVGMIVLTATE